ncbi:TetR/AcrR family transcriptional regulator [Actinoallomurus rhizosphaericola]|uniref:TetR/AcrR family transcriptional regulator n=1 Tax=Actinoallomurus rhizosphaericola TaxID=2952536 RepID=UPI0020937E88|nr:TetR/AcrR family transcriptional regulator [Actinoallomurus rhizosphaericola]MCO5997513.1 TetR/AcrR family transcriptional regulator [Actinoallomurus rhizosphaericola]
MTSTATAPRRSPARRRVLDTALALFYAEGIHAVGIDRIIAEAGVAKATFYHHFPSKDDLVCAYLEEQIARVREQAVPQGETPEERIVSVFEGVGEVTCAPGFRGCAFINAAAEYPDPDHPVRRVVADFRRWFKGLLEELLVAAGHPEPQRTAVALMTLRDGLTVAGALDDPAEARPAVRAAVARLIRPAA